MKRLLLLLSGYAIAMALLEAAVVVYMRRLYYPENPMDLFPMAFLNQYDPTLEISREVATVVMILTVAFLAERRSLTKTFAAFVFVFGVWDLFYYVWLKVLMDWPRTWLEWDVLFLIPMIWVGPWICPALIAGLFIVWGTYALTTPRDIAFVGRSLIIYTIGCILGLITFMQPTFGMPTSELVQYTPGKFWWWLYAVSFVLMTIGFYMTTRSVTVKVESTC